MPKKVGNIELYMGPDDVGAPDDLLSPIVRFIEGAENKLYIAVQELDHKPIADAIIDARQRGVQVRLVLEADYLRATRGRPDPYVPDGPHEDNRFLHDAILRAAIRVNSDFNPEIFHQKFMIRDRESVLTGSTNFTETGVTKNLNHVVIVHDKDIAKVYDTEFKEIRQGHFGKLNEGTDPIPEKKKVSNVSVKTLFAPDHGPEMEIMKQIAKAEERVDFAIFTFSQSSGIDDQLLLASEVGVEVRGAMCNTQANKDWSAKETLKLADIELYLVPGTGILQPKPRKLHHKLMVIDEQLIIAGSFNYTAPANRTNDENIMVIGDLYEDDSDSIKKQKKLARYALDEIDRIIDTYGEKVD